MNKTTVSFEFFPPKTDKGRDGLIRVAESLAQLNPKFMTVTFGAGGSTRDGTMEMACAIKDATGVPMAAHLTHICMNKEELRDYSQKLWDSGIRHIVALRGDCPEDWQRPAGSDDLYYNYTSCFVEGLLSHNPFEISVSAYPEKHPDASCINSDIEALKMKADAGATRAITQFFFDNNIFYEFLEKVDDRGITLPIVPGVLPIQNFEKMMRFANTCEAHVPDWLQAKLEPVKDSPEDTYKVAEEVLQEQLADLVKSGIEHIHFYALNKADLILGACQACDLGVKSTPKEAAEAR